MKKIAALIAAILLFSAASSCNLSAPAEATPSPQMNVETMVALTLTAIAEGAQPQEATPTVPTDTPTLEAVASTFTFTVQPSETPTLTLTPTITGTLKPSKTPNDPGTIQGSIYNYPYGSLPSLRVEVTDINSWAHYAYEIFAPGTSFFSIGGNYEGGKNVTPGQYRVIAYDPDGHAGGCTSIVTVKASQTSTCDITDWSGSYPAHH